MAAQKGISLVLKVGDRASPEVFTTVGGMRTNSININDEAVDVTNKDTTDRWRELLRNAGVRSIDASGEGVFTDNAAFNDLVDHIMGTSGSYLNFQVVVPGLGTFEGPFHISGLGVAGAYNDAVTQSVSIASADAIAFTTAA